MNIKGISVNVGKALLVSALFMLLSIGVSLLNGRDSGFVPLLISFLITLIVGAFPFIFVKKVQMLSQILSAEKPVRSAYSPLLIQKGQWLPQS